MAPNLMINTILKTLEKDIDGLCSQTTHDVCYDALESIKIMLDTDFPSTSRDIEKFCKPAIYLRNQCWHQNQNWSDCVSNLSSLEQLTEWLAKYICSEGEFRREYLQFAPCVWSWAKGQSHCSKSYNYFLDNLRLSSDSLEDNDIALSKLCCSFSVFSRCVSRQTVIHCGKKAGTFIARFLFKLAGNVVEHECANRDKEPNFQSLCLRFRDNMEVVLQQQNSNGQSI